MPVENLNMPNDIPSPGRAYHRWIHGVYPCIGRTIKEKFVEQEKLYSKDYNISYSTLSDSEWLEATTYISLNGVGVLVVWLKDGTGYVYDTVPSYEVGRLHGFAHKGKEKSVEELEAEHIDNLKRSLK